MHDVIRAIGWRDPVGPIRQELYQLVRVSDNTLFKFKVTFFVFQLRCVSCPWWCGLAIWPYRYNHSE